MSIESAEKAYRKVVIAKAIEDGYIDCIAEARMYEIECDSKGTMRLKTDQSAYFCTGVDFWEYYK